MRRYELAMAGADDSRQHVERAMRLPSTLASVTVEILTTTVRHDIRPHGSQAGTALFPLQQVSFSRSDRGIDCVQEHQNRTAVRTTLRTVWEDDSVVLHRSCDDLCPSKIGLAIWHAR